MKNLIILCLLVSFNAFADELRMSAQEAKSLGYLPVVKTKNKLKAINALKALAKHGMPWPVAFQDATHTIGNSMAQYQEYGDGEPYWHGGDDLRTARKAWVTAPTGGKLYGGHYSYVNNDDGSAVKHMLPWPQVGRAMYFEINITTEDGNRLEFHHVDRNTLTPEVIELLNRGGGPIAAGARLGQVIEWPMEKPMGETYHHIHYNIITSEEKELNPEWFSPLVPDTTAPRIQGVYGRYGQRFEKITENTVLTRRPDELIVASSDQKDGNAYIQPTDYVALVSNNQTTVLWDLRERLLTPAGTYPAIRQSFQETMRTSERTIRTQGNYNNDFFLMRLNVPATARAGVELLLKDQAGNTSFFRFSLP